MFLLHKWAISNLRHVLLVPDLYEKVVLFVFIHVCHLVQKLCKLLTFAIRV